jgi:AraC family transcriptional regulator
MSLERVSASCANADTAHDWVRAVRRSIGTMRQNLGDDHSLQSLACSAWLSPFHFHRVFHQVTDSTPARFLAAWRMAEAKRMLAYGQASVTDICMQVGYSSLGTFTSQFTRMVGMPPGRFRRLVVAYGDRCCNDVLRDLPARQPGDVTAGPAVTVSGGPAGAPVVAGLFASGIPQERPVACTLLPAGGRARVGPVPEGVHHMLAMGFDESVTVVDAVADADLDRCHVGAADGALCVNGGRTDPPWMEVRLRPRRPTDPPVVLALPLLLIAADRTATMAG